MSKFTKILKDVISTKAYAARTFASDPLQSFRFRITLLTRPKVELACQKIGGLSKEIAVAEYVENVSDGATKKLPGRTTYGEVTIEKGMVAGDKDMFQYLESVLKSGKRFDATIEVRDRLGNPRKQFSCTECWFSKWEMGDLDASSDDVIIETLTMQYEGLSLKSR